MESEGIAWSKVTKVVDFYHAKKRLHDISKTQTVWTEAQQISWVKERVTQLKAGYLSALQIECDKLDANLSNYFRRNILRLNYKTCRRERLPLGSGAVESAIRRIINLRLKGNGIFWGIENTEGLIHLRCQLLSGRWSKLMESTILPKEYWGTCAA